MDKAALVGTEFLVGERMVSALENAGIKIAVAMWVHFPEWEDWRFLIASKQLDGPAFANAYLRVYRALDAEGLTARNTPSLLVMKTSDPFIRALRKSFGKAVDVTGMRLGGQTWGNRYLDDAYAYKIA